MEYPRILEIACLREWQILCVPETNITYLAPKAYEPIWLPEGLARRFRLFSKWLGHSPRNIRIPTTIGGARAYFEDLIPIQTVVQTSIIWAIADIFREANTG